MKDIYVGDFTENDCAEKKDKAKVAEMQKENPDCKYIRSMIIKGKNKRTLRVWICDYYPD
jgi:hypothetical protein